MFLTPAERPSRRDTAPAEGVRVTYLNDTKHWFPGCETIAMILAQQNCPEELFTHPGTTLEYGERIGQTFLLKRHIRGPKLTPDSYERDKREAPSVILPEAS